LKSKIPIELKTHIIKYVAALKGPGIPHSRGAASHIDQGGDSGPVRFDPDAKSRLPYISVWRGHEEDIPGVSFGGGGAICGAGCQGEYDFQRDADRRKRGPAGHDAGHGIRDHNVAGRYDHDRRDLDGLERFVGSGDGGAHSLLRSAGRHGPGGSAVYWLSGPDHGHVQNRFSIPAQLTGGISYQAFLAGLESGQAYVNIHNVNFPGGEIRGWLTTGAAPVPEPATFGLGALALMGMAVLRRRIYRRKINDSAQPRDSVPR
jgi:hypothetical protein